ncbi:MAG: imidazoleglycerol-phosphate dehydratase HisB [Akkermansia sp.]
MRTASCKRTTGETDIALELQLDGTGCAAISTGHPFFDHMLNLLARHSLMNINLDVKGDLEVDAHHTIEDTGIAIGECIARALGEKRGINRYGMSYVPMDETLVRCVIDLSNRPYLELRIPAGAPDAPNMPLSLVEEFCRALTNNLRCNLHIEVFYGRDGHHIIEGIFKSIARTLRVAMEQDPRQAGLIPSTKGII